MYVWLLSIETNRHFLLKIPDVLQISLLEIFRCAIGVHFVSNNSIILLDFGVLEIALLKTTYGV